MRQLVLTYIRKIYALLHPVVIKIGSRRTQVVSLEKKLLYEQESVYAKGVGSARLLAIGQKAKEMFDVQDEHLVVGRLFHAGQFVESDSATAYFQELRMQIRNTSPLLQRLLPLPVICAIPAGFSSAQKKLLTRALKRAYYLPICFVSLGFGDYLSAKGREELPALVYVLRIGSAQTQIVCISHDHILWEKSITIGAERLYGDLADFFLSRYGIVVSVQTCERLSDSLSQSTGTRADFSQTIFGKDVTTALGKSLVCTYDDIASLFEAHAHMLSVLCAQEISGHEQQEEDRARASYFISGGGSTLPYCFETFVQVVGKKVTLLSRAHRASVFGIVEGYNRGLV